MNKRSCSLFFLTSLLITQRACFPGPAAPGQGLPYYTSADFTPHWLTPAEAVSVHQVPAFNFTDQQRNAVTQHSIANKIAVVDFFFASCSGICKKLTKSMLAVQTTFRNDTNVVLLSHTVTPERDSIPVLQQYARSNGIADGKWHLLTGDKNSIYSIARRGYFADEDLGMQQDSTSFLHTENILLIDKYRHIRGIYKGTIPAEINHLIGDIVILETED